MHVGANSRKRKIIQEQGEREEITYPKAQSINTAKNCV
jgi:hypothetical protein